MEMNEKAVRALLEIGAVWKQFCNGLINEFQLHAEIDTIIENYLHGGKK